MLGSSEFSSRKRVRVSKLSISAIDIYLSYFQFHFISFCLYFATIIRCISSQLTVEVFEEEQEAVLRLLRETTPTVEVLSLKRVNHRSNGQ